MTARAIIRTLAAAIATVVIANALLAIARRNSETADEFFGECFEGP